MRWMRLNASTELRGDVLWHNCQSAAHTFNLNNFKWTIINNEVLLGIISMDRSSVNKLNSLHLHLCVTSYRGIHQGQMKDPEHISLPFLYKGVGCWRYKLGSVEIVKKRLETVIVKMVSMDKRQNWSVNYFVHWNQIYKDTLALEGKHALEGKQSPFLAHIWNRHCWTYPWYISRSLLFSLSLHRVSYKSYTPILESRRSRKDVKKRLLNGFKRQNNNSLQNLRLSVILTYPNYKRDSCLGGKHSLSPFSAHTRHC